MRVALGEGGGHDVGRMRRQLVRRFIPWFPVILTVAACSGGSSSGSGPAKDAAWIGNTYVLTIPPANWTQPADIGGDIGAFVPQFLIGISQSSGDTMSVMMGTAMNGVQETCNVTTQVTADGSGYPNATITVPALPLHIVNTVSGVVVDTTVRNFTLTNVLPNGSTVAKNGGLSAVLDISELYPLFNQIPTSVRTPDGVCKALATANATCAACPTSGQPYCLTLEAVQLGAVEGTTPIMPIAASAVPASCSSYDAGTTTTPVEEAGAGSEAGSSMQPTVDAASTDAAQSVDASAADATSSGHLDAAAAADARGDNQ